MLEMQYDFRKIIWVSFLIIAFVFFFFLFINIKAAGEHFQEFNPEESYFKEVETPFIKKLDDAIFQMFGVEESYDFIARHSDSDPATIIKNGTSSHGYLRSVCDGFTLVCEMPYYFDKRVTNDSLSKVCRRKAVIEGIEKGETLFHFLKPRLAKIMRKEDRKSRLFLSVSDYLENFEARNKSRISRIRFRHGNNVHKGQNIL